MPLSEDIVRELKQSIEVQQMHGARSPTTLEWWYFTGHLWKNPTRSSCEGPDDPTRKLSQKPPDYGVQSTFFLSDKGNPKGILAHAAESNIADKKHSHSELVSGISDSTSQSPLAFAEQFFLNIALGHWRLTQMATTAAHIHWDLRFDVKGSEYLLQLEVPKNKFWFHGRNGYLQKTGKTGNFYYSAPFVRARGVRVSRATDARFVSEPVCGRLWFDHEMHVEQVLDVGWRWLGLSFSNRKALMFYEIQSATTSYAAKGELWDDVLGKSFDLKNVKITEGPVACLRSGRCYPQSFRMTFTNPQNGKAESVQTQAAFPEQEMDGGAGGLARIYWEGSTTARWTSSSKTLDLQTQVAEGAGYTELVPQVPKK